MKNCIAVYIGRSWSERPRQKHEMPRHWFPLCLELRVQVIQDQGDQTHVGVRVFPHVAFGNEEELFDSLAQHAGHVEHLAARCAAAVRWHKAKGMQKLTAASSKRAGRAGRQCGSSSLLCQLLVRGHRNLHWSMPSIAMLKMPLAMSPWNVWPASTASRLSMSRSWKTTRRWPWKGGSE